MDLLALAKDLAGRVEAEATRAGVPVSVCVMDIHGNMVLQHRMNGAPHFNDPRGCAVGRIHTKSPTISSILYLPYFLPGSSKLRPLDGTFTCYS